MSKVFGTEEIHPVYALKPGDHEAGVDLDSVNVKNYRHLTVYLLTAALTGDAVLTVNSGATAGAKTTAEGFKTRLADADQGAAADADKYGALSARVTTLTLTAATYDNKLLVIEVDLDAITLDQPWITVAISAAATAFNAAALIVLSGPRYSANEMLTATA